MATETGGASPDSTPATATDENVVGETSPEATPAAAAGSTTTAPKEGAAAATPKLIESVDQPRFSEAVDVEGYEKRKRDALKQVPSLEESAAAHEVPEEVTSAEGPVTSGEPPVTAAEETVEEEPPATEDESTPEVLPERIRLGGLSDTDKGHLIAAKALATAEKIPLAEAMLRVTGGKTAASTTALATTEEGPTLRPRSEIEAEIKSKKDEKRKAAGDLDTVKMLDLDDEIDTLKGELGQIDKAEAAAEQTRQTKFDQDVKTSNSEAVKFYPDSGKKGTPLYNRITEIAKRLEDAKDPLIYQVDAPLVVAQMAAKELRIAPADPAKPAATTPAAKPTTSTATRPAPVNQTAVSRSPQPAATPASGAARTNHGNGAAPVAFEKIKTVQDYEELKSKLLQPA